MQKMKEEELIAEMDMWIENLESGLEVSDSLAPDEELELMKEIRRHLTTPSEDKQRIHELETWLMWTDEQMSLMLRTFERFKKSPK